MHKSRSIRWKLVYTETNKAKRCKQKSVYANLPIPKQKRQNSWEDWVDRLTIGKNSVR